MPDPFVIKVKYGGLGDHLFYSHLPRIVKATAGGRRVLVSNLSEYRNPAYRALIWEANPFVDGFCDEDAPYPEFDRVPRGMNLLDQIMILRGLDDGRRFHEPELHLQPARLPALAGATVYDPNFVSNVGNLPPTQVERYFARKGIQPDFMLTPRGKGLAVGKYGALLETESLAHYCSVIVSAKQFICLTSGGATLAAALGRPALCLYGAGQATMFHHSQLHRYVNLNPLPWRLQARLLLRRLGRGLRPAGAGQG